MRCITFIYFLCCALTVMTAAPLENTTSTLYDAVVNKCPHVQNIIGFKDKHVFKACKDWDKIQSVDSLSDSTKHLVRCLIFYNAFTMYCGNTDHINITEPEDVTLKYNLETVCDKVAIIPSKDNLRKLVKNEEECSKVCGDEMGVVVSVCSISYYFVHLNIVSPKLSNETRSLNGKLLHVKDSSTTNVNNPETVENAVVIDTTTNNTATKSTKPNREGVQNIPIHQENNLDSPTIQDTKDLEKTNAKAIEDPKVVAGEKLQNTAVEEPGVQTPHKPKDVVEPEVAGKAVEKTQSSKPKDKPNSPEGKVVSSTAGDANPVPPAAPDDFEDTNEERPINIEDPARDYEEQQTQDDDDALVDTEEKVSKPEKIDETESVNSLNTEMDGDSYFFTYFMLLCLIFIVGYVCYHNKQKVLAIILEGRKNKRQYRGRRPNSANYHKLDTNLEEAITSSCSKNASNVIY